MAADPRLRPLFIGSEIYRHSTYGPGHPLAVPRVSTVIDLARALGWLPDAVYLDSPEASFEELARFHDPAYLEALQRAEREGDLPEPLKRRFRIGLDANPIYPEIFRRPATSAGGVMLAARLTREGGIVHVPGGGTHHGRPDRASGFCFVNDPVVGLLVWLDAGLAPLLYLDIDAHHGDGVEEAFAEDERVFTISIHEAGRWPRSGALTERRGGAARNLPVPAGFNDTEFRFLFEEALFPLIRRLAPQAIMLQAGADALAEDPLAKLSLSNRAYRWLVQILPSLAPRLIVLGGGGYNPYAVGRCWTLIWGTLNRFPIPARLPEAAEAVLRGLRYNRPAGRNPPPHWLTTLLDPPQEGPVRPEIHHIAEITLKERL